MLHISVHMHQKEPFLHFDASEFLCQYKLYIMYNNYMYITLNLAFYNIQQMLYHVYTILYVVNGVECHFNPFLAFYYMFHAVRFNSHILQYPASPAQGSVWQLCHAESSGMCLLR